MTCLNSTTPPGKPATTWLIEKLQTEDSAEKCGRVVVGGNRCSLLFLPEQEPFRDDSEKAFKPRPRRGSSLGSRHTLAPDRLGDQDLARLPIASAAARVISTVCPWSRS